MTIVPGAKGPRAPRLRVRRAARGAASVTAPSAAGLPLAALACVAACATADPPPGGEQDGTPPLVTEVTPQPGSTLQDLREPAVFHFDERISERDVAASVLVSPRTGDFRVEKGRQEVRVRQVGGWSPGIVYRVTLLPGIADMFGNARSQPVELVFSTGPEIPPTVLGGVVTDRMTGQVVPGAAVAAVPVGDTVAYVAIADGEGFFAIRFLPPGRYDLRGLRDADGDWAIGAFEPRAERAVDVVAGDTLVEPLALLAPDTTVATLVRVEYVDSVTLRLDFDDALDPEDPQPDLAVRVVGAPNGQEPRATPMAPHVLEETLNAEAEAAAGEAADTAAFAREVGEPGDSAAAPAPDEDEGLLGRAVRGRAAVDTAAAVAPQDTLGAPAPQDTLGALALGQGAERTAAGSPRPPIDVPRAPDGTPLPTRAWYVRLSAPLRPGATYSVFVAGARNVHGLLPGGGEAEITVPVPEAPDEEPPPEEDPPAEGVPPPEEDPPAKPSPGAR
ncbi:MAG TPA: Ig-like domain-containing protein [Longimicrobiales bacterium]|nr:Ig-like domain-containing protein [Longimicrobiales bacterium]